MLKRRKSIEMIKVDDLQIEHCNLLHIKDIKMTTILKCRDAVYAFLANAIGMYNISFFTPFLSVQLETYGFSDSQIGYCFLLASFPYFIATLVCPIVCKNTPRKLQFVICFIISALGFMFMGPSRLVGFPDKPFLLLIGLVIIGFIQALVFIPCLPEAIETFQMKYLIVEGFDTEFDNKLSDCMASLYSQFYNFAALVGPVIGGGLDQLFKYEPTMNVNMICSLFIALFFGIFNCGREVFKNSEELNSTIKKLKEIGEKTRKKKSAEAAQESSAATGPTSVIKSSISSDADSE